MKILDLSLTYHWYDEIASGRKTEEYREIKKFYMNRLCENYISGFAGFCYIPKKYDAIRFHRGQGSPVTMLVQCLGISTGMGKTEWGAPQNEKVFIIRLGRILSK